MAPAAPPGKRTGLIENVALFLWKEETSREAIDSAETGGWGYAHFNDGKPADTSFMQSCFPCHHAIKSRDDVFTRYAP